MQKPNEPTLYDLFDETSFGYWELQLRNGREPTPAQLADLIDANPDQPIPAWLGPVLSKGLRGKLKIKRGRPARDRHQENRLWLAKCDYQLSLAEQRQAKRKASTTAARKSTPRGSAQMPVHERVADEVIRRWRLPMSVRSFLNEVASRK